MTRPVSKGLITAVLVASAAQVLVLLTHPQPWNIYIAVFVIVMTVYVLLQELWLRR